MSRTSINHFHCLWDLARRYSFPTHPLSIFQYIKKSTKNPKAHAIHLYSSKNSIAKKCCFKIKYIFVSISLIILTQNVKSVLKNVTGFNIEERKETLSEQEIIRRKKIRNCLKKRGISKRAYKVISVGGARESWTQLSQVSFHSQPSSPLQ